MTGSHWVCGEKLASCQCGGNSQLSRRTLVVGGTISAAVALMPEVALSQGVRNASKSRDAIDVHHHIYPPVFAKKWADSPGWSASSSDPVLPATAKWSPAWMIEELDKAGVEIAVMSNNDRPFTSSLSIDARRDLARAVNEYATDLRQQYKGRLGLFGYLPMPEIDGSLKEIEYVFDTLKADGIHMMTSYPDSNAKAGERWLGDPIFVPLLEELNRRQATVFCHPRTPSCCRDLLPNVPAGTATLLEYPYDTGRTIMALLASGAFRRFDKIKWIFCHTGSVIPVLSRRLAGGLEHMMAHVPNGPAPKGLAQDLKGLNWDTAGETSSPAMHALIEFSTIDRVLFGSDSPFIRAEENLGYLKEMKLTPKQMRAIKRGNALRLLPTLMHT